MVSMTVPDSDDVDSQLVAAVMEAADDHSEVTITPSENDRPGVVKVERGCVHTSDLGDFEVVGVGKVGESALIHVV